MLDPDFSPYFADGDFELGGYRVQALAQQARIAFTRNAVFPHLTSVSRLTTALQGLLTELHTLRGARPGALGPGFSDDAETPDVLASAEAFARWAYGLLTPLVHEGETILDFARENVQLEPVGVLPTSAREGYLLVRQDGAWRAYRFAAFILRSSDEAALHASLVPDLEADTPAALKALLLSGFPDLPVPATFCLQSEFTFPAEATLLPVAGRKLPPLLWGLPGAA